MFNIRIYFIYKHNNNKRLYIKLSHALHGLPSTSDYYTRRQVTICHVP